MVMEGTDEGRKRKATQALLDRNGDIIAILNEFVKARGGGDPSSAEIALAREAYDNLLSLSLSTASKALVGSPKRLKTFVNTTRNLGILPRKSDQPPHERLPQLNGDTQLMHRAQQVTSVQVQVSARDPRAQHQAALLGASATWMPQTGGQPGRLAGQARGMSAINILPTAAAASVITSATAPVPPLFSFSTKPIEAPKAPGALARVLPTANQQVAAAPSSLPGINNPVPSGLRLGVTRGPELSTFSGPICFPVTGRVQPAASNAAPALNAALSGSSRLSGTAVTAPQASVAAPYTAAAEGSSAVQPGQAPLSAINPAAMQTVSNPFETSGISATHKAAREAEVAPVANSAAASHSMTLPPINARGSGASAPMTASGTAPTAADTTQNMNDASEVTALPSGTGDETGAEIDDATPDNNVAAGEQRSNVREPAGRTFQPLAAATLGAGGDNAEGGRASGPDGLCDKVEGASVAGRDCEQLEQARSAAAVGDAELRPSEDPKLLEKQSSSGSLVSSPSEAEGSVAEDPLLGQAPADVGTADMGMPDIPGALPAAQQAASNSRDFVSGVGRGSGPDSYTSLLGMHSGSPQEGGLLAQLRSRSTSGSPAISEAGSEAGAAKAQARSSSGDALSAAAMERDEAGPSNPHAAQPSLLDQLIQGSGSGLSSEQELEIQTQLDTAATVLPPNLALDTSQGASNRQMLDQLGLLGPTAEAAPPRRNAGFPLDLPEGGLLAQLRTQRAEGAQLDGLCRETPSPKCEGTLLAQLRSMSSDEAFHPRNNSTGSTLGPFAAGGRQLSASLARDGSALTQLRILRSSEDALGCETGLPSSLAVGALPTLSSANDLASTMGLMGPPDPPKRANSAKLAAREAVSPKAGSLMERFGSGLLAADIARGISEERSLSPLARQGSGTGSPMLSREASPLLGRFGSGSFAAEVAKGAQALPAAKGRAGSPVLERFGSGRLAAHAAMVTAEDALGPVSRSSSLDPDSPAGSWQTRSGTSEVFQVPEPQRGSSRASTSPKPDGTHTQPQSVGSQATLQVGGPQRKPRPVIPVSRFAGDGAPGWRPPPSPPRLSGNSPPRTASPGRDDSSNSRMLSVHSLSSWARGDLANNLQGKRSLQSRSSLHSKSSIQSQPSLSSWAGPGTGPDGPGGTRLAGRENSPVAPVGWGGAIAALHAKAGSPSSPGRAVRAMALRLQRVEEDRVPAMDAPSAPPAHDNAASPSAWEAAQVDYLDLAPGPAPATLTAAGTAPNQVTLEPKDAQFESISLTKTPEPAGAAGVTDEGNAGQQGGEEAMDDLDVLMLYSGGMVPEGRPSGSLSKSSSPEEKPHSQLDKAQE